MITNVCWQACSLGAFSPDAWDVLDKRSSSSLRNPPVDSGATLLIIENGHLNVKTLLTMGTSISRNPSMEVGDRGFGHVSSSKTTPYSSMVELFTNFILPSVRMAPWMPWAFHKTETLHQRLPLSQLLLLLPPYLVESDFHEAADQPCGGQRPGTDPPFATEKSGPGLGATPCDSLKPGSIGGPVWTSRSFHRS